MWSKIDDNCVWATGIGKIIEAWSKSWIASGFRVTNLNIQILTNMVQAKVSDSVNEDGDQN